MRKIITLFLTFVLIVIFSSVSGFGGAFVYFQLFENSRETTQAIINRPVEIIDEESNIINVAQEASKSVVSIIITKDVPIYENYYYNPFEGDPFFEGFRIPGRRQSGTEERRVGAGTGFVVSEDGLIITNRHVVNLEDASYTVIFENGDKFEATVLARDTLLDIAIIKIDAENLPALNLGSSSNLKVGQTVIAVGNALGQFSNTVSKGIVSGLSRDIIASDASGFNTEQIHDLIQTDASINQGNSGGPLLDINGNVIGVNVAVAQNAENIGFAIPIDLVKDVLERYLEFGTIERPMLGVRYRIVTEEFAEKNNLGVNYGALLVPGNNDEPAVVKGSPADKAGLKAYDIILEIDGEKITEENTLLNIIQNKRIGDEITVKYFSDGTEKETKIKLFKFTSEE
ncbi:MAG: hypothetical protein KatS3mg085_545 [Candidatus Dojkabacteria bacterium]|nr:MAG: hypothetical protein KatS3mg085_545 [Candidatus Dojkabacteria bacterium]